jgi:hypothetical protein
MKGNVIALVAAAVLLTLDAPAMAMGSTSYTGPVFGAVSSSNVQGNFSGTFSGTEAEGTFDGSSPLPEGSLAWQVSGTASVNGTQGTFSGLLLKGDDRDIFRGRFKPLVSASEPLLALAVGLGLVGARLLRRR